MTQDVRPFSEVVDSLETIVRFLRTLAVHSQARSSVYLRWADHLAEDCKSLKLLALRED